MEFSLDDITNWVGDIMWPFIRIAALFLASPIFGARTVPVRIRIILAILITIIIQPALPYIDVITPLSPEGFMVIFQQLSIGLGIGLVLQIIFATLVMAGHVIATSMGLGFASAVDPQNGIQVTMIGQFYLIIATLFFLAMDGHLLMLEIIVNSFVRFPIGGEIISVDIFWNIAVFSAQMFVSAVLIALPAMIGVLLVNLGFGVMTRAAPQLNIFAVGFPTTMLAGFLLMFASLPILFPLMSDLFERSFNFISFSFN